jgi:hypothetical protein
MRKETIYSLNDNGVGFDERDGAEEYKGTGVGLSMV